ncbi:MAG: hypothetical protein R6U50_02350 [Desulfobacterales bacterium]
MNATTGMKMMLFLHFLLFTGCAAIPPQAPELSRELGNRIAVVEKAHIAAVHEYFAQKRAQVDRFVDSQWVPVFAEEFFSTASIESAWNTIVSEDDKEDRLRFLVITGTKLQHKINEKRTELIDPLDDLEKKLKEKIRDAYAQIKFINESITGLLVSASDISERRSRYVHLAGLSDEKIDKYIEKTDEAVSSLLKAASGLEGLVDSGERFKEKIASIIN